MTTGQQLLSNSSLNSGTALQLLTHPSSGGGGSIVYIPVDDFDINFETKILSGNLDIITLDIDFNSTTLDGDLALPVLSADIIQKTLDGDLK